MTDTAQWSVKGEEDRATDGQEPGRASSSWLRDRPWLIDLAVALAVFAYNLPLVTVYTRDGVLLFGAAIIVSVGLCAPYVLRRRYPLPAFGIIALAGWLQLLVGVGVVAADIMLAFALYNVAVRFRWPVSVPAAAAMVLWVLVAVGPRLEEYYLSPGDLGLLVLVVVTAWTWGTTVRIRRDYIASLKERARQAERERESQARIVAAEERARIAREIHDIVSHSLSAVVVMSEGALSKLRSEPERAEKAMLTVRDTSRTAVAEMRRMLDVLRDGEPGSQAPQPGVGELERLVEESRDGGLPVELSVTGERVELSEGLDLAVYRVVQEALTNARKHAGPTLGKVEVLLDYRGNELEVRVTDDGEDSYGQPGSAPGGHGLVGMRERIAAYGGTLRTGPRSRGGFEVLATLPVGGKE